MSAAPKATGGHRAHRYIGPYLLQELLGHGNMGVVYKAWDERLDRPVALKRLRPGDGSDDRKRRFRREAKAVAQLSHPHIVRLFDLLETPKDDWLVMEWIDGVSLDHLLKDGPMPIVRLLGIVHQLAKGLQEAHRLGIIHRDLKAENVLVDTARRASSQFARDRVKILDFGLAKMLDPTPKVGDNEQFLTADGILVGTPHAMAPEQIRGQSVDPRCDLFALGALIYQGTTGKHPFIDTSAAITLSQICRLHPPPLRQALPQGTTTLPDTLEPLESLVSELLAKDPEQRPRTAREVAKRLAHIARSLPPNRLSASA